jgi:predicted amidohydrolase
MPPELTVATVQLTSTEDVDANVSRAVALVERAAEAGARFIALPENYGFLGSEKGKLAHAQPVEGGGFTQGLREVASARSVFVLAGSIPETGPDPQHTYNTSVLIGPTGDTVASYRKIHLFDVALCDGGSFEESASVAAGDDPVVCEVDGWRLGLTICYDLRFPELYRKLSELGVDAVTIPAAFTLHTGKDHWDVLLRARAIENQCFVVAPEQFGHHGGKRASWGKSQVIDPWGVQLAVAPEREGFVIARMEYDDLERARQQVPCLQHRRIR